MTFDTTLFSRGKCCNEFFDGERKTSVEKELFL